MSVISNTSALAEDERSYNDECYKISQSFHSFEMTNVGVFSRTEEYDRIKECDCFSPINRESQRH